MNVPGWELKEEIGSGGNATVWRARHEDGRELALKVLNSSKASGEPYSRFRNEVDALSRLREVEGILPLVESHLPEKLASVDRAWLAMPLATPIESVLAGEQLETVVEAMARIAETLAIVHDKYGLAHRDIKPGNLYHLDGDWLVGDFGLVHIPDVDELTRSNRPIGPLHFAPYEMIVSPDTADPMPADVYSLGKTLWVLATGQRFPPEGHQSVRQRDFLIAKSRPHAHASDLDRLIDRMTLMNPADRPKMAEVAADLRKWLSLDVGERTPVAPDLLARLRGGLEEELRERDTGRRQKEAALRLVHDFQEQFRPVNQMLLDIRDDAEVDRQDDNASWNYLQLHGEDAFGSESVYRYVRMSRIYTGQPGRLEYELKVARSLELRSNGRFYISGFVQCGHAGVSGADMFENIQERAADIESMDAAKDIQDSIAELWEKVQRGLEVFAARIAPASEFT